jgi:hypothetical protein
MSAGLRIVNRGVETTQMPLEIPSVSSWKPKYVDQLNLRNEAFFSFVDRLLTLATGALALSITFRKSFSAPTPVHIELLKYSWIGFTIAIIACLVVQYGRITFHRNMAMAMYEAEKSGEEIVVGRPARWFQPAARLMVISFFVGVSCLAVFAILNFS